MAALDLAQQLDAFEELVYEAKQQGFDQSKYERCYDTWGINFHMVEACNKN